jgi:hypothetical protein
MSVVDNYLALAEQKIGQTEDKFLGKLRNEAIVVLLVATGILTFLAKRK